jgi:hypothetical protein
MNTNRAISTFVRIQAFEIVAATLLTSLILKFFAPATANPEEYRALAYWIREWGFCLLGIPALWTAFVLAWKQREDCPRLFVFSGYGVIIVLFVFYAFGLLSAARMPMILVQ